MTKLQASKCALVREDFRPHTRRVWHGVFRFLYSVNGWMYNENFEEVSTDAI